MTLKKGLPGSLKSVAVVEDQAAEVHCVKPHARLAASLNPCYTPSKMKILLAQTGFLGDVVLSTPVIAGLSRCYPGSEIWMLTTPQARPLVQRDPLLKGVLSFEKRGIHSGAFGLIRFARMLREMRFEKCFSLHRSFRTSLLLFAAGIPDRTGFEDSRLSFLYNNSVGRPSDVHDVLRRLAILDGQQKTGTISSDLRLFPPAASECSPEVQVLVQGDSRPFAVLVPGSEWETKRWQWQGYRDIASYLLMKGMGVVICGSEKEKEHNRQVSRNAEVMDLTGRITLDEFLFIMKNAALLACNDSLSLHVGSAFKTPTVVMFCATSPSFGFGPWQNESAFIAEKTGLGCRPCRRHGGRKCPTGTWECTMGVSSEEVIRIVEEHLLPRV